MSIFKNIFNFIKSDKGASQSKLQTSFNEHGVDFFITGRPFPNDSAEAFEFAVDLGERERLVAFYLAQLLEEGYAFATGESVRVPWSDLYELLDLSEHHPSLELLDLPKIIQLQPVINCRHTLSEPQFELELSAWVQNGHPQRNVHLTGAYIEGDGFSGFVPKAALQLNKSIQQFSQRETSERLQGFHEQSWGLIRVLAEKANALYESKYLKGTIVITPETLELQMEKTQFSNERIVVIKPTFSGAPKGWLNTFDSYQSVQDHYDFSTNGGRVRVIIPPKVKKVLSIIKRDMPGRRVAGSKAEAFIHNPFSFLGEDSHDVINEDNFELNKSQAGIFPSVFTLCSVLDDGRVNEASLLITEHYPDGTAKTDKESIPTPKELQRFLDKLQKVLLEEKQIFPWGQYDLELDGESARQHEEGRLLLHTWMNQIPDTIRFEDVYTIENYGKRIEGIGVAKPIYVPIISLPEEEASSRWAPDEIATAVSVSIPGHQGQIIIPLDKEWIEGFEVDIKNAELSGNAEVKNQKLPTSLDIESAKRLVDSFRSLWGVASNVKKGVPSGTKSQSTKKETLLLKINFQSVDYQEQHRIRLSLPPNAEPRLPQSKRRGIQLMPHQLLGVAWLQNLLDRSPNDCRGALLADDMGLGKTLQLLSLLGVFYEENPEAAPSLIVAPVSLLDNWLQESEKFFDDRFPQILTLYGDTLQSLKQPKAYIDEKLVQEKGITNLLKPNWLGAASIVLTTYETLRDYEFSLARQDFSIMVCDEAQKIKTPNAMVTLAAKKQKIQFKIACTGTPVENTLADLWCLFDFIQPGFLGALDAFSRAYRRPIEAKTEDQVGAVNRLREIIAPQILRRTKLDISKDLPEKFFVTNNLQSTRLEIPISNYQRQLYIDGLKKLRAIGSEEDARKRARLSFEILHFIKAVCAEPYCLPRTRFMLDSRGHNEHVLNSPKIGWLIQALEDIKTKNDKVIIFTELREVQNALCHFLRERFNLKPYVINGDTKSRQILIDKFQAKEGFDVIVLSPLAAGFGLNIVKANHVIHFTRTWNPAKEAQATDRAYRIGAQKDVYVYCPTIVAEDFVTFEAKLDELMRRKMALAEDMLNGTGDDISLSELTPDGPDGNGIPDSPLTIRDVDLMDGESFEVACKLLWEKLGYLTYVTKKSRGDGGIDVIALSSPDGIVIQCKSSGVFEKQLGWDAVKEVTGGAAKYQMLHPGIRFSKLAVTNQYFNSSAIEQAKLNNVRLVQRDELIKLFSENLIQRSIFDEELMHQSF